ncbi:MAG: hypothetical protein MUF84_11605 [Anaerolineae bacterium]|jgi:hypothetical protein|nr:hypothetical protein [Anaerolineae bacterium]
MAQISLERITDRGVSCGEIRDRVTDFILGYFGDKSGVVFDMGMGIGRYGALVRKQAPNIRFIGLDGYLPYMLQPEPIRDYWMHLHAPIEAVLDGVLTVKADLTLCMDVIEHLSKEQAVAVLGMPSPLVVSTPLFMYEQDAVGGNSLETHLCYFTEGEILDAGFTLLHKAWMNDSAGHAGYIGAFVK